MEPSEEDRLAIEAILQSPSAKGELDRVTRILEGDIRRSRFNRERANQLFLFAIDNCLHGYFSALGARAAVMFPKGIRPPFAVELAERFVRARGNIEDQRPPRTGLLGLLLGK